MRSTLRCPRFIGTILTSFKMLLISMSSAIIAFAFILLILIIYWRQVFTKRRENCKTSETVVGIFHPYCNAGGGGERVLWGAVQAIQKRYSKARIVVYTGDLEMDPQAILNRVKKTFNIELNPIEFIYLHKRKWVEADMYPRFTLLAQSIGSMWLGFEALQALQPDIFLDTMGYAFTYPLFKYIGRCQVASYTHYPTISTDMLRHVYRRVISHNNHQIIARNPFFSAVKIIYYKLFALIYGWMGRCADIVMVNSSWTEDHINSIWKCPLKTFRVYPPCDIERLIALPLLDDEDKSDFIRIVSVAQFRPEKNHPLMLRAMFELREVLNDELIWNKVRLILIGSCRHSEDEKRVKDMQDLAKHLSLENNVEFKLNIPYNELIKELQIGTIGLHAMWNEHFGISVVEGMAAGLIMVANNSGGPRADIIETQPTSLTGFLATDDREYAQILSIIIKMTPQQRDIVKHAARASVSRFSCEQFEEEFLRAMEPLFRNESS